MSWLEGHLRTYPGAILIVTHDRYFLDNVTGWILELDRGRGIPYEGNYSTWLKQKQKRLLQEGREDEARQRALEQESEWIASSPKARQSKSKARIQRYEDLVAKSEERVPSITQIVIPVAERLGGSIALAVKGAEAGVQILRVHDVAETVQALRVWRGLRDRTLVG